MPEQTEQPNDQSGKPAENNLKSLDEFKGLSLKDMEAELSSKDYSKVGNTDQVQEDSETSDEDSDGEQVKTQPKEQASEDESTSDNEDVNDSSEPDDSQSSSDKQKKEESLEDRFSKLEKNYKALESEFTKRSQRLKDLERQLAENKSEKSPENDTKAVRSSDDESDPELAQLKQKDPKAYEALNKMIDRIVDRRVTEKVKPVEEQVTLRKRQDNANKFNKAVEEFTKSNLAELEPQIVDIINENPAEWQRTIWESDNAFEMLKKELFYRHTDKVARLMSQAEKSANAKTEKQERLKDSKVGTKTKVTQPTKDVMSVDEFKKLSLAEMEKRLPKYRN